MSNFQVLSIGIWVKMDRNYILTANGGVENNESLYSGPWSFFHAEMARQGWTQSRQINARTNIIFLGHFPNSNLFRNSSKQTRTLWIWEPPSTEPEYYKKTTFQNYGRIFVPFPLNETFSEALPFNWPQNFADHEVSEFNWKSRNKIVLMQANKFSLAHSELYTLRREVLKKAGRKYEIHLWGRDWNMRLYKTVAKILFVMQKFHKLIIPGHLIKDYIYYFGESIDKFSTLKQYKISIVIENDRDYFSEKFFDAVACQSIPLFVGPNLTKIGISNLTFLQAEPTYDSIIARLENLLNMPSSELYKISRQVVSSVNQLKYTHGHKNVFESVAKEISRSFFE